MTHGGHCVFGCAGHVRPTILQRVPPGSFDGAVLPWQSDAQIHVPFGTRVTPDYGSIPIFLAG
jgi:hypothetical protein